MSTVNANQFPSGWHLMRIGDLFEAKAGGDIVQARSSDVQDHCHAYPIYANGLTEQGLYGFSDYAEEKAGSITVTARGTLGQAFYRDQPFVAIGRLIVLTPKVSLDARYFCEYINYGIQFAVESTGVPQLTAPQISQYLLPVPPEIEQRAIAEVLSDVDGLINALDALITKKRAIKQATMQQLLTGKTRLPGFSGAWETKRLGELGEISGAGVDKKINPNEVPVRLVNYLDVYNKTFLYSKDLTHEVSARPDQVRHCVVEKGDIFFTPSSEVPDDIGCSAVAMEDISDSVYSYHVVRLRLKTDWDLYFRAYIFDTNDFLNQASRQCDGSGTRYVISLPKFRAMIVLFPPDIEEQRAIGAVLSDMDAEIAALEQRRDKTIAIKQGMMQQLLTGRVRLFESRDISRLRREEVAPKRTYKHIHARCRKRMSEKSVSLLQRSNMSIEYSCTTSCTPAEGYGN